MIGMTGRNAAVAVARPQPLWSLLTTVPVSHEPSTTEAL